MDLENRSFIGGYRALYRLDESGAAVGRPVDVQPVVLTKTRNSNAFLARIPSTMVSGQRWSSPPWESCAGGDDGDGCDGKLLTSCGRPPEHYPLEHEGCDFKGAYRCEGCGALYVDSYFHKGEIAPANLVCQACGYLQASCPH